MSPWRLRQIAYRVARGALIAYPTDTIWGLGCHPLCDKTVLRLQKLKNRPTGKGLILLSSNIEFCRRYIDEETYTIHYDRLSLPQQRPVTWVVAANKKCPRWLTGKNTTIAIRITHKPLINLLCSSMKSPLTSTSANFSGRPTCRNSLLVHQYFHRHVDYILQQDNQHSVTDTQPRASQIRDIQTNKVFRP